MEAFDYSAYTAILREELVPAMGCTEPIAIAYAAANARELLHDKVTRAEIAVSGNIIKNVKSVVVPHTGGMHGIESALAVGVVAGDASRELEVLSDVKPEDLPRVRAFLADVPVHVVFADTPYVFDINVTLYAGEKSASVRILHDHTHIVERVYCGKSVFHRDYGDPESAKQTDHSCLTVERILEYADHVDLTEVLPVIRRQLTYNLAIAEEGIRGKWGASVGRTVLSMNPGNPEAEARAYAAAGSDARMSGCELPVIINSGSGNQGITACVPVAVYARRKGYPEDKLIRALLVSNLIAIHLKSGIGTLSAYCGAISAGVGAGTGIAYLEKGTFDAVAHTLVNAIAIVSGVICDGAKPSCAAKIAAAIDAGFLGYHMYCDGNQFYGGDGIVKKGVENTIRNVGKLAHNGMCETDREIIRLMVGTDE